MVVKIWNKLTVADGMLCRRSKSNVNKCIVPEGWWVTIMKLYHDVPGSQPRRSNENVRKNKTKVLLVRHGKHDQVVRARLHYVSNGKKQIQSM